MNNWIVIGSAAGYLLLLFLIAFRVDKAHEKGKSIINNAYVYALSMAVYCTAWTYYGSVGRASTHGIEFLTTYLGPLLMAPLFGVVLRKMLRISRSQRIVSIADFISSRYGNNFSLAILVTLFSCIGLIPYIALQLKAISTSFLQLSAQGNKVIPTQIFWQDTAFYISIALAVFIMLFGTRSVDASEKHEGLVAAIATESIIKLIAFLAAGIFVTYSLFDGFKDIFQQAAALPNLSNLFTIHAQTGYFTWLSLIFLSSLAILFLPRQFQVNVVENLNEKHIDKAIWLFPLYLLIINLFVLPIAMGGKILLGDTVSADVFVLALPLQANQPLLALFVFIGGFAAATSMIIVETIALSTMVSNNILMPILLSFPRYQEGNKNLRLILLLVRRISIISLLLFAYFYNAAVAPYLDLASIGLVSFTAVAQFSPSLLLGMYWKHITKSGAITGMVAGFVIWAITLVIPSMVEANMLPAHLLQNGIGGLWWLKPGALFGVQDIDPISHALFFSLLANISLTVAVSIFTKRSPQEIYQAEIFVDIFQHSRQTTAKTMWRGTAFMPDILSLVQKFLGPERGAKVLTHFAQRQKISLETNQADPQLVGFAERVLGGVIGTASARIMVASVTKEEEPRMEDVVQILEENREIRELNKALMKKSQELSKATADLSAVNTQLREMDVLKDEFLYTVTHELRTPLTSIRALGEIVHDNPEMPEAMRQKYLSGIVKESERLTHLISQVLKIERYESGRQMMHKAPVHLQEMIESVVERLSPLAAEKHISMQLELPATRLVVLADKDLIHQVIFNLCSNAIKFVPAEEGRITIGIRQLPAFVSIWVEDNGKGVPDETKELIFDKFFQARNQTLKKPEGSGLGLAISKNIVALHGGRIWVEDVPNGGARFIFTIPTA